MTSINQLYSRQMPVIILLAGSLCNLSMRVNYNHVLKLQTTSSSMNPLEQHYHQIEKECLAICNCFQKFDQWLYGKPDIEVHTTHRSLVIRTNYEVTTEQGTGPATMNAYEITVVSVHSKVQGGRLFTWQTHSLVQPYPHPITAQIRDFDVFRMEMESDNKTGNPRLTEGLEQLCGETSKDTTLNTLYKVTVNRWPADRADIPESLRQKNKKNNKKKKKRVFAPAGIMGTNCK